MADISSQVFVKFKVFQETQIMTTMKQVNLYTLCAVSTDRILKATLICKKNEERKHDTSKEDLDADYCEVTHPIPSQTRLAIPRNIKLVWVRARLARGSYEYATID